MASFTDLTVHGILTVGGEDYMHGAFWGCKLQRKEISAYRWTSIIESDPDKRKREREEELEGHQIQCARRVSCAKIEARFTLVRNQ